LKIKQGFQSVKPIKLKTVIKVLQELGSTCDETANALSGATQEVQCAKRLWGKHMSEQEQARLVKLGLNIMHFPGLIPSIARDSSVNMP
jgi:hypothetical protein